MMRLRRIGSGRWTIAGEEDPRGGCPIADQLDALAENSKTRAIAAGFRAQFALIPAEGPTQLPDGIYHRVDSQNGIYEFIKGRYRILCFAVDGNVIVCSTIFLKDQRKTPKSEVKRAIDLKNRYMAARAEAAISWAR